MFSLLQTTITVNDIDVLQALQHEEFSSMHVILLSAYKDHVTKNMVSILYLLAMLVHTKGKQQ